MAKPATARHPLARNKKTYYLCIVEFFLWRLVTKRPLKAAKKFLKRAKTFSEASKKFSEALKALTDININNLKPSNYGKRKPTNAD